MATPTNRDQAVALLAKAERLPLASSQRLALLAEAQVHASLALLDNGPAEPAAKAAPRKPRKAPAETAKEEAPNAE